MTELLKSITCAAARIVGKSASTKFANAAASASALYVRAAGGTADSAQQAHDHALYIAAELLNLRCDVCGAADPDCWKLDTSEHSYQYVCSLACALSAVIATDETTGTIDLALLNRSRAAMHAAQHDDDSLLDELFEEEVSSVQSKSADLRL